MPFSQLPVGAARKIFDPSYFVKALVNISLSKQPKITDTNLVTLVMRKKHYFWCSYRNFRPFLFCDGFTVTLYLFEKYIGT